LPMDLYLERGEEFLHHALNREWSQRTLGRGAFLCAVKFGGGYSPLLQAGQAILRTVLPGPQLASCMTWSGKLPLFPFGVGTSTKNPHGPFLLLSLLLYRQTKRFGQTNFASAPKLYISLEGEFHTIVQGLTTSGPY
jgi:hypothetical protein